MRITIAIDPRSFIESHDVDHKGVTFPVPCPGWSELVSFRVRPSIHVDVAPDVCAAFVYDQNALLLRQLNELERKRCSHRPRPTRWKAVSFGIVFGQSALTKFPQCLCPWLVRNPFLRIF